MNTRERFLASMTFEPVDRPLLWEFGYWVGAIRRWYKEGLSCQRGIPESLGDSNAVSGECLGIDFRNPNQAWDVHEALNFDEFMYRSPINNCFVPAFEPVVMEEKEGWVIMINPDGETVQIEKGGGSQHVIDSSVKTRDDFEKLVSERFNSRNFEQRLPEDWEDVKEKLKNRTFPLIYGGNQGFFNTPRRLLTFEKLMVCYYDDPDLIKAINQHLVDFLIGLYEPLIQELGGEAAFISEDMAYKSGPFISPKLFREFCLPYYKQLTDFYRSYGIENIFVDSDGMVMPLIPLLEEAGVTGLFPWEVQCGNDVLEVRKNFPRFQILGGLDKKEIAKGKDAIDAELKSKVPTLAETGGYVPFIDHTVPPEISWSDFCYYREKLESLCSNVSLQAANA